MDFFKHKCRTSAHLVTALSTVVALNESTQPARQALKQAHLFHYGTCQVQSIYILYDNHESQWLGGKASSFSFFFFFMVLDKITFENKFCLNFKVRSVFI